MAAIVILILHGLFTCSHEASSAPASCSASEKLAMCSWGVEATPPSTLSPTPCPLASILAATWATKKHQAAHTRAVRSTHEGCDLSPPPHSASVRAPPLSGLLLPWPRRLPRFFLTCRFYGRRGNPLKLFFFKVADTWVRSGVLESGSNPSGTLGVFGPLTSNLEIFVDWGTLAIRFQESIQKEKP